jgi:hypothetical protein
MLAGWPIQSRPWPAWAALSPRRGDVDRVGEALQDARAVALEVVRAKHRRAASLFNDRSKCFQLLIVHLDPLRRDSST